MHEKEVTQTEIHKGQIEWDRISAHSSFLHGKAPLWKKTNQLTPTPIQTLNQPCCKATEWISNQDPYS